MGSVYDNTNEVTYNPIMDYGYKPTDSDSRIRNVQVWVGVNENDPDDITVHMSVVGDDNNISTHGFYLDQEQFLELCEHFSTAAENIQT